MAQTHRTRDGDGTLRALPTTGRRVAGVPDRFAGGPPGFRVRFTSPSEFCDELRRRGPNVEPVVRLTYRWTPNAEGLPLCHLSVVAGYLRRLTGGVVVVQELVYRAGDVWRGLNESDAEETRTRADRARDDVARAAAEAGFEVCAGAYAAAPAVA